MKHLFVMSLLMALSTVLAVAWFSRKRPSEVARSLKTRFPHATITEEGDQITVSTETASVAVVRPAQNTDDADVDDRRLIHVFAEVERALRRNPIGSEHLAELLPIPLSPARIERTDDAARFVVKLHPELEVGFAVHSPTSGHWLTERDALELDHEDLLRSALTRLHQTTDGATVYRDGALGAELYLVRQDDGLDASRLLLAPLWEKITQATGAPLVIAAPARDRIYAAPSDQPRSLERLIARVREDWDSRAHPLSTRLWVWENNRLQPWHLHA